MRGDLAAYVRLVVFCNGCLACSLVSPVVVRGGPRVMTQGCAWARPQERETSPPGEVSPAICGQVPGSEHRRRGIRDPAERGSRRTPMRSLRGACGPTPDPDVAQVCERCSAARRICLTGP